MLLGYSNFTSYYCLRLDSNTLYHPSQGYVTHVIFIGARLRTR
jgi:hypothetical protein